MKKLITISAAVAATTVSAVAQQNIAGFDFSQAGNTGGFLVDDSGTAPRNVFNANYTNGTADFNGAADLGSIVFDGSFGSSNIDVGIVSQDVFAFNSSPVQSTSDLGYLGAAGSLNTLTFQGQSNATNTSLGFNTGANGQSFVLALDVSSLGFGEDWGFTFGGATVADAGAAINWDYSVDGSNYASTGITSNLGSAPLAFGVDLSNIAALDGQSSIFVRGTFSGIDGQAVIDNFSVDATIVPEPSTYAAIAGALALAFVAYRRRS